MIWTRSLTPVACPVEVGCWFSRSALPVSAAAQRHPATLNPLPTPDARAPNRANVVSGSSHSVQPQQMLAVHSVARHAFGHSKQSSAPMESLSLLHTRLCTRLRWLLTCPAVRIVLLVVGLGGGALSRAFSTTHAHTHTRTPSM
jgi:hypothetical protein